MRDSRVEGVKGLMTNSWTPMIRPHSLEHSKLEFSGPSQGDGLVASPGFINAIGGLLPMAPWGRTSL
jgi:hypothetical protein